MPHKLHKSIKLQWTNQSLMNHIPPPFFSPPRFLWLHAFSFPSLPPVPLPPPPPPLPLPPLFSDAFGPDHTEAVGLQQETDPDLLGGDGVQHLARPSLPSTLTHQALNPPFPSSTHIHPHSCHPVCFHTYSVWGALLSNFPKFNRRWAAVFDVLKTFSITNSACPCICFCCVCVAALDWLHGAGAVVQIQMQHHPNHHYPPLQNILISQPVINIFTWCYMVMLRGTVYSLTCSASV